MSKFAKLLSKLNINETFNKTIPKPKTYNKVKDNIPLVADYNMMADLLFLPTAKFGYKYLFVIVDLASDAFDIEPIKNKEPATVLKAMKKCFTRDYINEPEYTLKTDSGTEFKGVFQKYLYDESILHKVAPAGRHTSMGNVESLNRQLGRLIMGYLNSNEEKAGKRRVDWLDAIDTIREELNEIRLKKLPKNINEHEYPIQEDLLEVKSKSKQKTYRRIESKFKVGQHVYRYLDHPEDALGKKQNTAQRRQGDFNWDRTSRKIRYVITMGGRGPLYRYVLKGLNNVSFTEQQLKLANKSEDED